MNVNKHTLAVLDPIVEAAREVLADMERDDIPAGLRKVARSSARTLPPPFARSVVRELARSDRSEFFLRVFSVRIHVCDVVEKIDNA